MGTGNRSKRGTGTDTGTGTGADNKKKRGRPKGSKSGYKVSEKALAQRRANMPNLKIPLEGEEAEYNARYIQHVIMITEIASHADIKDPESMRACFINYLRLCEQNGFKVGNMAACAAMGIDYRLLDAWSKGEREEYRNLALFVKKICAVFREGMVADQKINPVIGIFWQRNFDGLRNDTEQQQTLAEMNDAQEGKETVSEYRKKYGKLLEE